MPEDERRGLLTEREKEILRGDADVSEKYYYVVVSRVRMKIGRIGDDADLLEKHHPTLGDELQNTVCDTS